MRQLRQYVLGAEPKAVDHFIARAQGVAALAEFRDELDTAIVLASLAERLERRRGADMRDVIYAEIDRAHAALRMAH